MRILVKKYGSEWGDGSSRVVRGPYDIHLWKHVRMGLSKFSRFINFEVGRGTYV